MEDELQKAERRLLDAAWKQQLDRTPETTKEANNALQAYINVRTECDPQLKLLPCPFCGHDPTIEHEGQANYMVRCSNVDCPLTVKTTAVTKPAAISAWNTRASAAPPAPVDPVAKAAVELAEAYTAIHPAFTSGTVLEAVERHAKALAAYRAAKAAQQTQKQE